MKLNNLAGQPVDSYRVDTYSTDVDGYNIKISHSPDSYAFSKDAWASGGDGRLFVGREMKTREAVAIKEIRLKKPKKGKFGGSVVDWNEVANRAVWEVQNAWRLERSFGPVRAFTNNKKSKFYIVQKLMSGDVRFLVSSLSQYASRSTVVRIVGLAIARDVQDIHNKRLIHFDIKPENICYNKKSMEVEVLDFGLSTHLLGADAEATAAGSSSGYAPWEQMQYLPLDQSADVFALGATFGELLTEERLLGTDLSTNINPRLLQKAMEGKNEHGGKIYADYMKKMKLQDERFGVLVAKMMHWSASDRPEISAVVASLESMQPEANACAQVVAGWQALPALAPAVRAALWDLDRSLDRIASQDLQPTNSK